MEISSNKRNKKIALIAGIGATFAVGALIGAQFASEDNSFGILNMSSNDDVQLYCTDIQASGEMRTYEHQWCASIQGSSKYPGIGNLKTEHCNGTGDQNYQYCSDGTFRNVSQNSCLQANGKKVAFAACGNGSSMQWTLEKEGTWNTNGVDQHLYAVKNQGGQCMVINGNSSGSGTFGMGSCGSSDSHVYVQNNGKMIASGNMVNGSNKECVQMNTRSNMTESNALSVKSQPCSTSSEQVWSYYENGWIVNSGTNWCLEPQESNGSGSMVAYPCTGDKNQLWSTPMYSGNTYVFENKASDKCFQFSGSGNPQIVQCDNDPQQQFSMDAPGTGSWSTPQGSWGNNNCNESGSVSLSVTQSITYTHSITDTVTTSVAVAIEAKLLWASITTTTTVSNAVATQFQTTVSEAETYTYSCQYYADTGKDFTTGCIWQGFVQTSNLDDGSPLTFNTSYVACTPDANPPKCPPMETCSDSACTSCVNMA